MSGKAELRKAVEIRRLVLSYRDKRGRDASFSTNIKIDLFILLLLAGCILAADHVLAVGNDRDYEKINIVGEDSFSGVYDPSVEYGDDGVGWLVYSANNNSLDGFYHLETHLAKSLDHGKTWTKVGAVNNTYDKVLVINGKVIDGFYREETATLLFDPDDPNPNRRWKLFTVTGFSKKPHKIGEVRKATYWPQVYIAYKYAADPEALSLAQEIPLFGSKYCQGPVCSAKYNLNSFNGKDLGDVSFYEESGSLVNDGILYLSLSAVTVRGRGGQSTILLSSGDHGQTWKYVGKLTYSRKDAKSLGYDELTASSLAEENGRVFLLVSPVKQKKFPPHLEYNGVYIFEFDDITKAKLKRDNNGRLIVQKYLPPLSTRSIGGGQSEYHEQNTYGGIIMAQSDSAAVRECFTIYSTKERIVDNMPAISGFQNPQKVEIQGYDGDALEPFITRDGQYLFFNNGYQKPKETKIFYAVREDRGGFQFMGELDGVKIGGCYSMTPAMDNKNNFYFASDRAGGGEAKICSGSLLVRDITVKVSNAGLVSGNVNINRARDPELSPDGEILYFAAKRKFLDDEDLKIAVKREEGFTIADNSDYILQNINTGKMEYAPAISSDGLELFFTRVNAVSLIEAASKHAKAKIYLAKRNSISEPFGKPEIISAIAEENDGIFVEAPSITTDGKILYYHKKDGKKFSIYKVTKR